MTSLPVVHSFFQSNIDPRLVAAQARVFEYLGVPLQQHEDDTVDHAGWMNRLMLRDDLDEVVVIADIDAFPLSYQGYNEMITSAGEGALVGLAQTANHKDPRKIYAGPMFMAFRKTLYQSFGAPDLGRYKGGDVAQIMTDIAQSRGVEVSLIYPRLAIRPLWPLADRGIFGVGTFYGDDAFFHLYQSRRSEAIDLFCAVADGVIAGHHDWATILSIIGQPKTRRKQSWLARLRIWT